MSAGDDRNGNFVFVASAGRKLTEKGLTSDEQRNVCLEESCVMRSILTAATPQA